MSFVRTVTGDVDPSALGVTLAHEHLIIDSQLVAEEMPDMHLPSVPDAVAEVELCRKAGIGTMVDAMPIGSGGHPNRLRTISENTGALIVASTGMHTAKYYRGLDWPFDRTAEQLSQQFIDAVEIGVDGARAGVLKMATSGEVLSVFERRLFEAAAIAHRQTGVPLLTHCEEGKGGDAQIEFLASLGVDLALVALSHTDKVDDLGYHQELLDSGVLLCYDQVLRTPEKSARLIREMIAAGYGSHLLIGTDGARRSLWHTLGGTPGLSWVNTGFRELLTEQGLTSEDLEEMFAVNPARWLTFSR